MKIAIAALATFMAGAITVANAQQITGAGSSFGAPIYGKWGEAAATDTGVKLNYQAIGSGGGINQINNRTVDFGASDMPVAAADLASHKLMQFPTVMGAVVIDREPARRMPNQLQSDRRSPRRDLPRQHHQVERSQAIEAQPGVKLPSLAIAPVYRADGSGTTYRVHQLSLEGQPRLGSPRSGRTPA